MRIVSMILFVTVSSAVYLGGHYFIYRSIANGLSLGHTFRVVTAIALALLALSFILYEILSRAHPIYLIDLIGSVWLGCGAVLLTMMLIRGLMVLSMPSHNYTITIAALALSAVLILAGLINGMHPPRVRKIEIVSPNLPDKLNGLTIAQLSDVHIDAITRPGWSRRLVERVNAANPDLIVFTGDVFEEINDGTRDAIAPLAGLHADMGKFAITGNHEYYIGEPRFRRQMKSHNVRVLANESVKLSPGLALAGVNDPQAAQFDLSPPDIATATLGASDSDFVILLSHRPMLFKQSPDYGVDIQLSGHTHAGQIVPFWPIIWAIYGKYTVGLRRSDDSFLYTSPGTGTWGTPIRLFSRNEITLIILGK